MRVNLQKSQLLRFITTAMLALPVAAADRPESTTDRPAIKGRVEDMAVVDPTSLATEQATNTIITNELQSNHITGRFANKKLVELSQRSTALGALEKNLNIQRGHVAEDIAKAALWEAQAVFNPVLLLGFTFDRSETFTRQEQDVRFRRGTEKDATGNDVLREDDPTNQDIRDPSVIFDGPRTERLSPTTAAASVAPLTGPTESLTYDVTLFQQLPWGANLTLAYQARDQAAFFVNNSLLASNNPNFNRDFVSFGSYDRPWVSSLLTRLVVPVPGSKDFGPYAEQHVTIKLAELGRERAFWNVESLINNTLLEADITYWDLINRLLSLRVTIENRKSMERLLARTDNLYNLQEVTNYDKAQIEAELARVQGEEESAWNNYVLASNALVRLLNLEGDQLLLPVGYIQSLAEPFLITQQEALARGSVNNPDKAVAGVDVSSAMVERERRAVRVRPNVNFVGEANFIQSNRLFGYSSFGGSIVNVGDPDIVQQAYSLEYIYPWGNRALKARLAQAEAGAIKSNLALRLTDNSIHQDLNNALVQLASTHERVAITERNVKLAELTYEKALQQQGLRGITEYQVAEQNKRLLTARLNHIVAQTARKQAEARVLAALGILPKVYAERSAQTELDRRRLELLKANDVLRHFGDHS